MKQTNTNNKLRVRFYCIACPRCKKNVMIYSLPKCFYCNHKLSIDEQKKNKPYLIHFDICEVTP